MTLSEILAAIGGKDGNAAQTAAALGLGTAGLALAEKGYSDVGDIGERAYGEFTGPDGLAQELSGMLEFQPYTVTSATGGQFGMQRDPTTGQMTYQLQTSPEEQALQRQQMERAGMFFEQAAMPTADREQEVYQRMRTVMSPEEERQRLALEQRLAAQGRLGVTTGMFGGTPEALVLGQEQQRQAQLGSGMLAAGYVPQAQLLNALQPGMTAAERARQAQAQQAQTYGQTYASGLEALLQSGLAQANLAGGFGSSLATAALGGLFS
jgi:hypothetical protein